MRWIDTTRGAVWVKMVGIALVIVALSHAFDPNWPIPLAEGRRTARPSRPAWTIHSLSVDLGAGADRSDARFTWAASFDSPTWQLVLLDAQRREVAWGRPTAATSYRPEGAFRDALTAGTGRFWFAVGERAGRQVRSPLAPVRNR